MPFWTLDKPLEAVALIEEKGRAYSYGALKDDADRASDLLDHGTTRSVGVILFDPRAEAIALYLAALRSGAHVPLLLQPSINPMLFNALVGVYAPEWIAAGAEYPVPIGYRLRHVFGDYGLYLRIGESGPPPHPDCALLLSTSGSTGSPKLVRLSYTALAHNAEAIARYLGLRADDRAISTLPLAYSFGMSILNSHLEVGGSLTLTGHSVVTKSFWNAAISNEVTSLSGVPSTFEILRRADIANRGFARLRMLTQAGGRLRDELIRYFAELAENQAWSFFVMYGQTEAGPRISYVPPERLREKIGSIGVAIPGGALALHPDTGELIYRGPNVMMGYALARDDLAKPDECCGVLRTGDLGRQDADGFFFITGRLKRFIKLSGCRINLDEVESRLVHALGVPVACVGDDENLVVALPDYAPSDAQVRMLLRDLFEIYGGLVRVVRLPELPVLANGKLDYRALEELTVKQPAGEGHVRVQST
jgi:acyl-coenzyme A synthetase/AMP-(fatty) acid ligase